MIGAKSATAALLLATPLVVSGCTTSDEGPKTVERAVVGTAVGAGIGAGIGAVAGDVATGAAVGAGVGLLGGLLYDQANQARAAEGARAGSVRAGPPPSAFEPLPADDISEPGSATSG